MTIPELARKAGVTPLAVYQMEHFQRHYDISIDVTKQVAEALGVQMEQVAWPYPV